MKVLKKLSTLLKTQIEKPCCLICHKQYEPSSILALAQDTQVCNECLSSFTPLFKTMKVDGYQCEFITQYEDPLKQWLLQYKEQNDYALKDIFLSFLKIYINVKYHGYHIVVAPSSSKAIERRGFSHMYEMTRILNMPIDDVLINKDNSSQKGKGSLDRSMIKSSIDITNPTLIKNEKILVVDDVYTTGSTLKSCFAILAKCRPKIMKGLVIMKANYVER